MPLILLLIPILFGFAIYGLVRLHAHFTSMYGWPIGIMAVLVVVALACSPFVLAILRHRRFHGVRIGGQRVLALQAGWGELRLDALSKQGSIVRGSDRADFIFADIGSAHAVRNDQGWSLVVTLHHAVQKEWRLPMPSARETRRWARILSYAAAQQL